MPREEVPFDLADSSVGPRRSFMAKFAGLALASAVVPASSWAVEKKENPACAGVTEKEFIFDKKTKAYVFCTPDPKIKAVIDKELDSSKSKAESIKAKTYTDAAAESNL